MAGEVEIIESILRSTARYQTAEKSCSNVLVDALPNTSYGYGIINVLEAVKQAILLSSIGDNASIDLQKATVYPNPAIDHIFLDLPQDLDLTGYKFFDLQGRIIQKKNVPFGFQSIDISAFDSGMYFLLLESSSGNRIFKIIKQD